jgi:major membrane immunogen (membrane-anchored lipoprotein)
LTVNLKTRSNRLRIASILVGLVALLLLAGCGSDDEKKPGDGATGPVISTSIDLTVEDGSFNKDAVTAKAGTIKITVNVPSDADGKHGVGIDGGQYKNIKGAAVAPGRSTSLTVAVTKGDYTIFDSYKDNKNKGYETKLTVK